MVGLLLLGVTMFAGLGCDSGSDSDSSGGIEFINNSSYTVTVGPGSGEDFGVFTLAPGKDKTIKSKDINGGAIEYQYTQGGLGRIKLICSQSFSSRKGAKPQSSES